MFRRSRGCFWLAACALSAVTLLGQVSVAAPLQRLRSLIGELASDDPQMRQRAAGELMNLNRKDLPMLRAAALSESPLLPGQVDALRQVVAQVYLAGERFQVDPEEPSGFLGIQFFKGDRPQDADALEQNGSIIVLDRIEGFPAYRCLELGDVILSVQENPRVRLAGPYDFINLVQAYRPGELLHLSIIRGGRAMTVAIPLDFRPLFLSTGATGPMVQSWINLRQARAESYWNKEFAIIDPSAAPDASQASAAMER